MMKSWNFKSAVAILMPILIAALSMTISCDFGLTDNDQDNELEKLPPITQTGENTFGCLVNGEAFVVKNTSRLGAVYQGGTFSVAGEIDNSEIDRNISIFIGTTIEAGTSYELFNSSTRHGDLHDQNANCIYHTEDNYTGQLTITYLDEVNFLVAGTFEFEAFSAKCKQSISVTAGRFDMQYIP